tara:strand:- start:5985 stop:6272 length:288 start_codon:yes stop_codon:yes gene_type:complete
MARQPIDTLRAYFLQGDVPTQGQFNNLIDSTYNATSGINDFNTGFANLSTVSLSAGELYIDTKMGSTQSLTVALSPSGSAVLTITNGIITNIVVS